MSQIRTLFTSVVCLIAFRLTACFVAPPLATLPTFKSSSLLATPPWQSYVSTHPDASLAVTEILHKIQNNNTEESPKLAFLFVGQRHASQFSQVVQQAYLGLGGGKKTQLVSILASGVVGEEVELDEISKPSMSLLLGTLPDQAEVELTYFNELSKPPPCPGDHYWNLLLQDTTNQQQQPQHSSSYLLFADPWAPVKGILKGLERDAVIAGGISVPINAQPTVALDDQPLPQGSAVLAKLKGTLQLQAVVAHGCRPVGPSYRVTAVKDNCILTLDEQPAIQVLQDLATSAASVKEERIITSNLVGGLASSSSAFQEEDDTSSSPEYLIRQIAGFVPNQQGFFLAGDAVSVGDRFRFFVRDGDAAHQDFSLLVQRTQTERLFYASNDTKTLAALQISCQMRGRRLFGCQPRHVDLTYVQQLLPSSSQDMHSKAPPVAGFYANGEIGPVGMAGFSATTTQEGGGTHVHVFTTVVALLCETTTTSLTRTNASSSEATLEQGRFNNDESVDAWG